MLHPSLAIAGLLLVAIPIAIHLLNRRRFRTVQWAAMEYLLQAMRRNRRRMRFESWLLLAVRCLVLALAGLALARPIGCADSALARVAGRDAGLHVLIVDDSASMAFRHDRAEATTHFEHARRLAAALIGRLDGGAEQVAVFAASAPARDIIGTPTYDVSAAGSAVEALPQTMRGTDLPGALERAVRLAEEASPQVPKTLHIISDATASTLAGSERLAELSRQAAEHYRVVWHNLAVPGQSNSAVLEVRPESPLVRQGFDTGFLADLQRFGGVATDVTLTWRIDGQPTGPTQSLQLAPQRQAQPQRDIALEAALADGLPHVLSADLGNVDGFSPDNAARRVVEQVKEMPVLIVEGQRGLGSLSGSGAFLAVALEPGEQAGYVDVTTVSDLELPGRDLHPYRAVVLAGVGNIAEPVAQSLSEYVRDGGLLMLWMGEAVSAENYNAMLLPRELLPGPLVQRVRPTGDSLIGFDFDPQSVHPYLAAFQGAQRSGLDVPAIRQYWQLDLSERRNADIVLSYLPQGDPAVVTWPVEAGRVLLVTTAASDPEWTLLPLKDNYPAFVHELLSHAVGNTSGGGVAWQTLTAGQRLALPASLQPASAPVLTAPDGETAELRRQLRPDGTSVWESQALEQVGVYSIQVGDRAFPVAVNLTATESDLRPLDEQSVRAAMGDIELTFLADQLPSEMAISEEDRADFGWSLLLLVLLLAGLECFLAMRFGRYKRV